MIHLRLIDRCELPGFQTYLLPETVHRLEQNDENVIALGAVTGRHSCGVVSSFLINGSAELTDLFVDAAVRRQGIGGLLLDSMLSQLSAMEEITRITANYVLRDEELTAMDRLLTNRGFTQPVKRSLVYEIPSKKFLNDKMLGRAFSPQYRSVAGIKSLSEVPESAILEMEENVPKLMRWSTVRDRVDPELSAVMVRDGRVVAYQLVDETAGGIVLRSIASVEGARPVDFLLLLREVLNRCWYWIGGGFTVYLSALSEESNLLTVRLTEGRNVMYEEHVCWRSNPARQIIT